MKLVYPLTRIADVSIARTQARADDKYTSGDTHILEWSGWSGDHDWACPENLTPTDFVHIAHIGHTPLSLPSYTTCMLPYAQRPETSLAHDAACGRLHGDGEDNGHVSEPAWAIFSGRTVVP